MKLESTSGSPDWRPAAKNCVLPKPLIRVLRIFRWKPSEFHLDSFGLGCGCFGRMSERYLFFCLNPSTGFGATVFVSRNNLSAFSWILLSFQLTTLVFALSSFLYSAVFCQFVPGGTRVRPILAHTIHMQLMKSFQTIQLYFLLEV